MKQMDTRCEINRQEIDKQEVEKKEVNTSNYLTAGSGVNSKLYESLSVAETSMIVAKFDVCVNDRQFSTPDWEEITPNHKL